MNKYKLIIQGETEIFTGFFKSPNVFASSKLNVTITKGDTGLFAELPRVPEKACDNMNNYADEKEVEIENNENEIGCLF